MRTYRGTVFAVALLAAGVMYLLMTRSAGSNRPVSGGSDELVPSAGAEPLDAALRDDARSEVVVADSSPRLESAAEPVTIRGRCVDATSGEPLAGCVAEARPEGAPRPSQPAWPNDPLVVRMETAADGIFVLRIPADAGERVDRALRLSASGHVPRTARWARPAAGRVIDVGDVPMLPAIVVRGVVVDTEGAPVHDAGVLFVRIELTGRHEVAPPDLLRARTDVRGQFGFDEPACPGEWYFGVEDSGALVEPRSATLGSGEAERAFRVVVERPDASQAITGVVVDDRDVPMVDVRLNASGEGFMGRGRSRADGTFVVQRAGPVPDDGRSGVSLGASDGTGEFAQIAPAAGERVAWGARGVRVVLRRLASLRVRVVDERGRPVPEFVCIALRRIGDGWSRYARASRRGVHDDGGFELVGLRDGPNGVLVVPRATNLASTEVVPFTVESGGGERGELVVVVRDAVSLEVALRGPGGRPVAGSAVDLLQTLGEEAPTAVTVAAPVAECDGGRAVPEHLVVAVGETGVDGVARLVAPPGTWTLRVVGDSHVPVVRSVDVAPGMGSVRIAVEAGAAVRGRVGPDQAWARLRALAEDATEAVAVVVEPVDGALRYVAPIDAGGEFAVGGLPAGDYAVSLRYWLYTGAVREGSVAVPVDRITVAAGEQRELPIDAASLLPGVVRGRVAVDGAPLRDTHCFLRRLGPGAAISLRVATDAEGRFEGAAPPGEYGLAITLPSQPGPGWIYIELPDEWELASGAELELSFDVVLRRVRVQLLGTSGAALADHRVKLVARGFFLPGSLRTDAAGWVEISPAPLRPFQLELAIDGDTVTVGPIELPAGVPTGEVVVRVGG